MDRVENLKRIENSINYFTNMKSLYENDMAFQKEIDDILNDLFKKRVAEKVWSVLLCPTKLI